MDERSLPKNPAEAARIPEPGLQVNRVNIIKTGPEPLPQPTKRCGTQPIDDDQMGPGYSG